MMRPKATERSGGVLAAVVVDADSARRGQTCHYLSMAGMVPHEASSVAELDDVMAAARPGLVVLDANLPGEDAFSIALRLRATCSVGIIMLTSPDQLDERVLALSAGADVCLDKPVQFREFQAHLRSLIRRLTYAGWTGSPKSRDKPPARGWSFDPTNWSLLTPNGGSVPLTNAEYRVLQALMAKPGTPSRREAIAALLGKVCGLCSDRSLDAVIARLRRKVSSCTGEGLPLKSARAVGYVFAGRVEG